MLGARKSKNFNMSQSYNFKFDWKAVLPPLDFHPRKVLEGKFLFFAVVQHWRNTGFFKINWLNLLKFLESSWASETKT